MKTLIGTLPKLNRDVKVILILLLVFGTIYSLISLVNHYLFKTYALDLGAYTNALYDYVHLQWNDSTVFKPAENLLADHFDLYLMLFSPLSILFGSYTLLVVQILAVMAGGIGVYLLFKLRAPQQNLALWAMLYFYLFFSIYTALSFDYHSNVVAAMLVPFFFYFIQKENRIMASVILFFVLVSKESISLWMIFVCLGLAIEFRKNKKLRNYLILAASFCIGYFILITGYVMPVLSHAGEYPHFHYTHIGNSSLEVLWFVISKPLKALQLLFVNHTQHYMGDYVKLEVHLMLVACGLPLLFWKPQYVFMLVPIYFTKMFNDDYFVWGIGGQYSIEFAPIMAIGVFEVICSFRKKKLTQVLKIVLPVLVLASTIRMMDRPVFHLNQEKINFYQKRHYQKHYEVKPIHQALAGIPKDAVVSAQSPFLPHLALRDNIYQFPTINDAEYIITTPQESTYPIPMEDFLKLTEELKNSVEWELIYEDVVTILRKVKPRNLSNP